MDLVQFSGQERVDLADLQYGLNTAPTGLINEVSQGFISAPGDTSIVQGFVPSVASPTGPVTVGVYGTQNTAWLAMADGSTVTYGVFCAGGTAAQSLDISTFAAGAYGIYVRFNRTSGEPQNRAFWSSVDAAEYAKLTNTRFVGSWEVRIETAQPSPEWLLIGSASITSGGSGQGNLVTVVDKRPLYFEGSYSSSYKPTWGTAADRGTRQTNSLTSLRQTLDAIKACLVDIKGPGIATWNQSQISGLNVGPGFALGSVATANTVAIGDALCGISVGNAGTNFQLLTINAGGLYRILMSAQNGNMGFYGPSGALFAVSPMGYTGVGQSYNNAVPLTVGSNVGFSGGEMAAFYNRGSGTSRHSVWTQDRIDISAAYQLGYTSEYPNPRVLLTMGASGGQIQGGILLNNNQTSPSYYYALKFTGNSANPNDITTNLSTKNVTIGSSGLTQLYGDLRYGNSRFVVGSVGLYSGVVLSPLSGSSGGSTTLNYNAISGDAGASVAVLPLNGSNDSNRSIQVTFNSGIPNGTIVLATLQAISSDSVSQKDWKISYFQLSNKTIEFTMIDGNGKTQWGSFSFLILNGAGI